MNGQKPDIKSADPEDGDHAQPINLVASRTPVPVTTFSSPSSTSSTPSLAMRTHLESKSGMMTLYFRTQAPRTQGQVMGPIVGTQVSSSQHFAAKPAQDFKNTTSFTVIRMPSDLTQVQGGTTTPSSSTPTILPTSHSSGGNRHMIPAAVQPVIAASHSGPALASLIRGTPHQVTPSGHVIHPPFSSHVPRGPAAVASISAAPKSAVATPIIRTPHSAATMALASSSMMALHTPVRVKSPTLANRTATPPIPTASSAPQVIDLQKTSIGHSMPSTVSHVGLNSRTLDGSVVRSGSSHASSITIAKPVNISQPIVQHLQQVYDKGSLKTVSNLVPATSTAASLSSHMPSPSAFISMNDTSAVSTISRTPSSTSYSNIMQLSSQTGSHMTNQQTLRVTPHVGQSLHTLATTTSGGAHQTLTVIAAKSLMPANHSIALTTSAPRSATPITTVSAASGNISIVPGPTPRSLTITNAITPTTIPVAKVYPQSTPITRNTPESTNQESGVRQTSSFIMQGVSRTIPETTGSFIMQGLNSNSIRGTTPTTSSSGSSSIIAEKQPDSSGIHVSSFNKSQIGTGAPYTPSSTTYLYHDQYASNLAMHPYNSSTSSQVFNTQLRPISFSQHSSSHSSSQSSLPVSNPVMVAVDSRHHLQLRSPYAPNSGKSLDTPTPLSSSGICTAISSTVSSVVSTSYNTLQSQSTVNNHTSPRPSILRKRPSESICNVAKKNLSVALSTSEFISNRTGTDVSSHFSSVLSPKPIRLSESNSTPSITDKRGSTVLLFPTSNESFASEKSKEVVSSIIPVVTENQNILIPVIPAIQIKKEIDTENSNPPSESPMRDMCPIEASPRKKPRKQQLSTNELMETHSSDGEENNLDMKVKVKEEPEEEKSKYITFYKRPNMSLLNTFRQTWKPRHNHFGRYSDVKPKEEKKLTVSELANQKGILQQANGWKVYHLTAQMDEVTGIEESVYSQLSDLLQFVEGDVQPLRHHNLNSEEVRIINKLTDLIKGNLQRSKIVQEQVAESKQQAIKVLDHKANVAEMVNKYISKRPLKKKDKS